MCGIAGIIRYKDISINQLEIENMTRSLAHRGPDGEGFFVKNNIALGHRRLSIIDLNTGQQPMCNEDKRIWITYNGEIYNFFDLKDELEKKHHIFQTKSETEVIIHAYEEWGLDCLKKFRGMFAFGIADFKKNILFFARDQFGIKPFYYRVTNDYIAFASEISALRQVFDKPPTGSLQSIDYYLRYQYIPYPRTIFNNIYKLPPAHYMIINFNGKILGPKEFYPLPFLSKKMENKQGYEKQIETILNDSVESHLIADVPVGIFLSGGVDSTIIALNASKNSKSPLKAFGIDFEDKEYSELKYAEEAAKKCGVELHWTQVTENDLESLPELISHYGEPFGDSSIIPTWKVSKLAREQVKVVLSGDGGDETFAGYDTYIHWIKNYESLRRGLNIQNWVTGLKWILSKNFLEKLSEWEQNILFLNQEERQLLWLPQFKKLTENKCELFVYESKRAHKLDRLKYAQYMDYKTYLPCDILTKVDIASMYFGLEVRPPLLDKELLRIASGLPLKEKIFYSKVSGYIGKYILKKLLIPIFSRDFIFRRKQGFAIPRATWFLPNHKAREMLNKYLFNYENNFYQFFNVEYIINIMKKHSLKDDHSGFLWLILILGIWFDQNTEIIFTNE